MTKYRFALLCTSLLVSQTACSTFSQKTFDVKKQVVFKEVDGQSLKGDVYVPKSPGLKPAILVVHGGGWKSHSGDMESVCKDLARAGYVVFNTTYRLAPQNRYPKQVEDVRDALSWMKSHASEFQIDTARLGGWGYSAGAHLILLVGLDPSQNLKAIVAGGTPADLTVWPKSPLVIGLLGQDLHENEALWREASPVNHVTEKSPPVFLYHGEWDKLVEPGQARRMSDALAAKKVESEVYLAPWQGHITTYFFSGKSVTKSIAFLNRKLR